MAQENRETEIIKAAEKMVRAGGYNAFSFRDIARTIGIKSSSVHYHFPTKANLGAAVARYYTDRFMEQLGDPENLHKQNKNPVSEFISAFREAWIEDNRMCLCGLLGAEMKGLPEEVATETRLFFEKNTRWLTTAYTLLGYKKDAEAKAIGVLALLEGALILSNVSNDITAFDKAVKGMPQS